MTANQRRGGMLLGVVLATLLVLAVGCAGSGAPRGDRVRSAGSPSARRAPGSAANPWLCRHVVAITHNGGEDEAPGDTLFALQVAHDEGMQVLDVDVQESSDGIPVLIHNDTLDSHTNGHGPVSNYTAAQLNQFDAAYWFSPQYGYSHTAPPSAYIYRGVREGTKPLPAHAQAPSDFGIATLEEAFQRFPDAYLDIELKVQSNTAVTVAQLIQKYHREDKTIVASFSDAQIAEFHALAPTVAISPGQTAVTNFFLGAPMPPGFQVIQIPYKYDLQGNEVTVLTPGFLQRAHEQGLAVWVWDQGGTPGQPFYAQLAKTGVDGILAARPTDLLTVLHDLGLEWDGQDDHPPCSPGSTPTTTTTTTSAPTSSTTVAPGPSGGSVGSVGSGGSVGPGGSGAPPQGPGGELPFTG